MFKLDSHQLGSTYPISQIVKKRRKGGRRGGKTKNGGGTKRNVSVLMILSTSLEIIFEGRI